MRRPLSQRGGEGGGGGAVHHLQAPLGPLSPPPVLMYGGAKNRLSRPTIDSSRATMHAAEKTTKNSRYDFKFTKAESSVRNSSVLEGGKIGENVICQCALSTLWGGDRGKNVASNQRSRSKCQILVFLPLLSSFNANAELKFRFPLCFVIPIPLQRWNTHSSSFLL